MAVTSSMPEVQAGHAHAGPAPCNRDHVLIVDDDKGIRDLFRMILSDALTKTRIDLAANGAEAVESFRAGRHGLLLLDLNMPIMDGYAAFRRIEELCRSQNWKMPSVVFCTGFAPPDTVHRVLAASSRHVLVCKPVSPDTLVSVVKSRLVP